MPREERIVVCVSYPVVMVVLLLLLVLCWCERLEKAICSAVVFLVYPGVSGDPLVKGHPTVSVSPTSREGCRIGERKSSLTGREPSQPPPLSS